MVKSFEEKTEAELWQIYQKNRDPQIRDFFVKQYAPLVKYVAGKVAIGSMPSNVEFDDLVSFGVFGLFDAIEKFNPDKHVKFKIYAVTRIRGSIFDELRSIDWVPRSVRQKAKEVEEVVRILESQFGRTATDEEIAGTMHISLEEFHKLILKINSTSILSIDDVWNLGNENDKISIKDSIESPDSMNPDIIFEKKEMKNVIIEAINGLPEKEKKVLVLYYFEDLAIKEIGEVLGVTKSRISQLHTKAIMRLRSKLIYG